MAKRPTNTQYLEAAKKLYNKDGELEFDAMLGTRLVSKAPGNPDKGAFIQCWRWIYDDDVHAVMRGGEKPNG